MIELYISETNLSDAQIADLKTNLPKCDIVTVYDDQ